MLPMTLRQSPRLAFHLMFIGIVSLYDAWLVIALADEILWNEQNLVGRYLIELTNGDVTLFVSCKLFGTAGALSILAWLGRHYMHIAMPVARSMSIFQLWLLWFLTCSVTVDPLMPLTTTAAAAGIAASCLWPYLSREAELFTRRLKLQMARRRRAQRQTQLVAGS